MSAAEVLAEQLESRWGTTSNWAEHILDALKAAGYVVVELPAAQRKGVFDAACRTRATVKYRAVHVETLYNGPRDEWRDLMYRLPISVGVGALLAAAVLLPAHAKADPITPNVAVYAAHNAEVVCSVLDDYPTIPGVNGVIQGIADDGGLTPYESGEVLAIAVLSECPRHTELMKRFIATYAPAVHA